MYNQHEMFSFLSCLFSLEQKNIGCTLLFLRVPKKSTRLCVNQKKSEEKLNEGRAYLRLLYLL